MSDPQVGEVWGTPGKPRYWRLVQTVADDEIRYQEFGNDFRPWRCREEWDYWVRNGAVCISKQLTEPGEDKR